VEVFEQSVVDARVMAQRPWTLVVSFAGQAMVIGLAVLFPLLHPEAMQIARLWIPIEPPRAYHAPPPQTVHDVMRSAMRPVNLAHKFYAPPRVPDRLALIEDVVEDAPSLASGAAEPGVPGGIDLPGASSSAIRDAIERVPRPLSPQPVAAPKEPPKHEIIRIRPGGLVQAAKLTYGPAPAYPPLARQARISGVVALQAVIATDGTIMDLRVTSGHPLLVPSALDAVKRWRYKPTLLNGDPVEVLTEITVNFTLQ
jgi:protein TonB